LLGFDFTKRNRSASETLNILENLKKPYSVKEIYSLHLSLKRVLFGSIPILINVR